MFAGLWSVRWISPRQLFVQCDIIAFVSVLQNKALYFRKAEVKILEIHKEIIKSAVRNPVPTNSA